jgi:hypothetical protein
VKKIQPHEFSRKTADDSPSLGLRPHSRHAAACYFTGKTKCEATLGNVSIFKLIATALNRLKKQPINEKN